MPAPQADTQIAAANVSTSGGLTPQARIALRDLVEQIRLFMRDSPDTNRLIAGFEHSNRQIVWAIADTLDDYNTTPPFTNLALENIPSRHVLIRGVVCTLLESVGLLQTRNQISFSDGGLQVGLNDKTPAIMQWLGLLRNTYEEKKKQQKIAMNIESAWGTGQHSEYIYLASFLGDI